MNVSKTKKVKVTLLNELDKQILLYFIERKTNKIALTDLFNNFYDYNTTELQRSILRLSEYGIFILLRDLTLYVNDIAVLLQTLFNLRYSDSVAILSFVFRSNLSAIRHGKEVIFSYNDIQSYNYDDIITTKMNLLYRRRKKTFWNAVSELCRRGYLTKITKGIYRFEYKTLDSRLLLFLDNLYRVNTT